MDSFTACSSSTHHICMIFAGIFSLSSYCCRTQGRTPGHWLSSARAWIPIVQKPALNSADLWGQETKDEQWHTWLWGWRRHVSFGLSPAVLRLRAAETLQTSVTRVKRCLEVSVNHHLLCSRFQHVEHLWGSCSNKSQLNSQNDWYNLLVTTPMDAASR